MFDIPNVGVYIAACVVLLLIPGPAVLYIVARSAQQGVRAGLVSVAGIHVGTIAHIGAAVLGLSAILATSATAFTVVKLAGAAYLVFLAVKTFREGSELLPERVEAGRSLRAVFTDGAVVNVLNPKTALFFLAFVPQFVDPAAANPTGQIVVLGLIFTVLGIVTDSLYALVAGRLGVWLRRRPKLAARQHWVSGTAYFALGVTAAVSE